MYAALRGVTPGRLVLVGALALLAGCEDITTGGPDGEVKGRTGVQEHGRFPGVSTTGPQQARAASASCPQRCRYSIREKTGLVGPVVELTKLNEAATLLGMSGTDPVLWNASSGTRSLAPPQGYSAAFGHGQNNWGQVAGRTRNQAGDVATVWEPNGTAIVLSDVPFGAPLRGEALAINDNSVIVGWGASGRAFRTHYREGFRWLAGTGSSAVDVNNDGQVVGWYTNGAGARRAALWASDGTLTDLGTLPGFTQSEAVAIGERGAVVGISRGANDTWQGFIWSAAEGMKPLEARFVPTDVNHWGEVAGWFSMTTGQANAGAICAVYYAGYGMLRLPSDPDSYGCIATSINSWGDVAGYELVDGVRSLAKRSIVWTWSGNEKRYGY